MGFLSKLFGGGGGSYRSTAFDNLRLPTIEEQKIKLEEMVQQGLITPEQAQAMLVEGSAYDDIELDPTTRNTQLGALNKLGEIIEGGGMTAMDKARVAQINDEFNTTERGAREAINQNMAERGIAGGGSELAAKLAATQSASSNASRQAVEAAAEAQRRELEAIMKSGELGGQIRGQDYGQASERAAAADAIAKFNAQNKQQVNLVNTASKNAAQEANLREKQRVADANTATRNYGRERDSSLIQQDFDNRYKKAAGVAGVDAQAAEARMRDKDREAAFWGNIIGTGGAVGAAALSDENEKKEIEPAGPDLDAFMESLGSKKYKYRNPKAAGAKPGQRFGVTAQEVEKTPVGASMVKDTPGGKMIDPDFGVILASLARLHDKIDAKGAKNGR